MKDASKCLLLLTVASLSAVAFADDNVEAGFQSIFDGKSLSGWAGATESYKVKDGSIVCIKGSQGNLLTEKEYADFVLRFEFRLTKDANNGLAIRSPLEAKGNLHIDGIELQILDNSSGKYKDLKPYQFHGSVYGVVPAKRGFQKKVGEWNEQEVTVKGRRVKVVLNGETILDANLDESSKGGTLDKADHPGLTRAKGHIGFLGHGDEIYVRKILIKEI